MSTPTKIIKPKKTIKMRKVLIAGILGVFALGMTSCGGGHTCDAYRTSDYTKYKADHSQKVEMIQELTESTK
jgi:hypothetical protein